VHAKLNAGAAEGRDRGVRPSKKGHNPVKSVRPTCFSGRTAVPLNRRHFLQSSTLALAAPALSALELAGPISSAAAQGAAPTDGWRHGISLFGDIKYQPDFKHFDYVNPSAPKGGAVRLTALGTFDNFNIVIMAIKGNIASGVTLIYDSLMISALDEVSTMYGQIAESANYPDDFSWVVYRVRANAKWHDGKPVTADDVIYSFEVMKKNDPQIAAYYRHVVKAEKIGDRDVKFTFDGPGNRELPQIVGQLTVLPKHWWEGTDPSGKKRDITATTLEIPLGCGAYRIKSFEPGRTIVYERVADYWGKDLNVNIGRNNFGEIRFEYFRDSTVALEAFKADRIDYRTETSAKDWATAYDFPAVKDGRVIVEKFPARARGVMQAFVLNNRRDKFKDARVRRAFNFAFDFEEMNKQIFFDQYQRINSYFDGTDLASKGLPEGLELAILETVRAEVPPEVFTTPYSNPVGGNPQNVRENLREALRLFKDAGYEVKNTKMIDPKGQQINVELLVEQPAFERVMLFYAPSLQRLGINATVRQVDPAQYENRLRSWDFDVIIASWPESLSPGNEQRYFWSSEAADQPGSRNFAGIKNPAVDKLINRVIFAKSRAELEAATRALDRVLLWNFYVVPQWTYPFTRTARWDRFGRPEVLPKYAEPDFLEVWWWDAARAAKVRS
jgi:microcin C transport system substrate-binding protein